MEDGKKMALKDWKKFGTNTWQHKKYEYFLAVEKTMSGQWVTYAYGDSIKNYDATAQYFKTKSQALKFAKSYMRKN